MRKLFRLVRLLLVLAGLAAVGGLYLLVKGGVAARAEPGQLETMLARRLRSLAIPAVVKTVKNGVAPSREAIASGMAHFADHCASCHANDGSGDTELGRGLYPRAPDMRLAATQDLSDGELFFIIENGIRFTGMPAWGTGTAEDSQSTWELVHFIRHLPHLTAEELELMKGLNPKSPGELREEQEIREFLEGGGPDAPAAPVEKP